MRRLGLAAIVAVSIVGGYSRHTAAQTGETAARAGARKLGYEGVAAYEAGNFPEASDKFEKAFAVLRVPTIGLWSARALVKRGKLLEATERYLEVTRLPVESGDPEVQKQALADARTELDANQQLTPTLQVRIEGADASAVSVTLDGARVVKQLVGEAAPLNPGAHTVEGVLPSGERVTAHVVLAVKEEKVAVLAFKGVVSSAQAAPLPVAPDSGRQDTGTPVASGRRTAGWIVLGAGGVGLAVGATAGLIALVKRSTLDENPGCADRRCPSELAADVDSLNAARTVSTGGFIVGGVLAVTGVVLVLTTPRATTTASVWATPTSMGLRGTF